MIKRSVPICHFDTLGSMTSTIRTYVTTFAVVCLLAASAYAQADKPARAYKLRLSPHWLADDKGLWYRNELADKQSEFVFVDTQTGKKSPLFQVEKLRAGLIANEVPAEAAQRLLLNNLAFSDDAATVEFECGGKVFRYSRATETLERIEQRSLAARSPEGRLEQTTRARASRRTGAETSITFANKLDNDLRLFWLDPSGKRVGYGSIAAGTERQQHTFAGHVWMVIDSNGETLGRYEAIEEPSLITVDGSTDEPAPEPRRPNRARRDRSGSGDWSAAIDESNIVLSNKQDNSQTKLTQDGSAERPYDLLEWSPTLPVLVSFLVEPGEELEVHRIESSPEGGGRARLQSSVYPLPGDRFTHFHLRLFDVAKQRPIPVDVEAVDFGMPRLRWREDGKSFTYEKVDRGHQRFRLIEVNAETGASRALIDEQTETFVWTTHNEDLGVRKITWLDKADELIFASEKDGWNHLYLVDAITGDVKNQVTKGNWVVRGIDRIDEEKRQVWFRAGGLNAQQDPYLIHHCRVNFDGTGLVDLTPGDGQHRIQYSSSKAYYVDTYSRIDLPPVHELRRAEDGSLITALEQADVSELLASGWRMPEVFHAPGRDDSTEIWGIIVRPRNYDPSKKYPVIEAIYAGPHSSHTPKAFATNDMYEDLTSLGFVVVKCDGMGTAHRSKAFHDVCWHNLKDAGFPDRIAWMKAAARKDPGLDLSRVGIFGTSAGGQNAAGALLFHGDFYKAAVAACGCHDNRMDKASWNEQWMGYPVGPHYAECSNIDNAHRLNGKLMLIVGELDNNVPPESTLRFADALIKADKDFDLLVVPGMGHSDGGPYGRRRTRDFFVEHLKP